MIELYTWTTPNGRKASIMLEEIGLPYTVRPINLGKNEQFDPAFLKISPNNKIPAIVDEDAPGGPLAVFESGAILIYLAEKTGRLLAKEGAERYKALEWLNWQMGGIGPMFGQLGFFAVRSTDKAPLAITRFTEEGQRLLDRARPAIAEKRLSRRRELHHRGHRRLSLDARRDDVPWRGARAHHRGDAGGQALAEGDRRARRGQARDGGAEGVRRKSINERNYHKRAGSRLSTDYTGTSAPRAKSGCSMTA